MRRRGLSISPKPGADAVLVLPNDGRVKDLQLERMAKKPPSHRRLRTRQTCAPSAARDVSPGKPRSSEAASASLRAAMSPASACDASQLTSVQFVERPYSRERMRRRARPQSSSAFHQKFSNHGSHLCCSAHEEQVAVIDGLFLFPVRIELIKRARQTLPRLTT